MSTTNRFAVFLALAFLFSAPIPLHAQVQRSFINLSFEQPALQTPGCRVYIAASQVPGWNTTHPSQATENVGGCVVPTGFAQTAPILEMWRTPRDNASGGTVNARSGVQLAELNAAAASRIYQNVCLLNGERINWRFSHRGRASSTVRDVMEMKIGASSSVIRVGTTNSGAIDTPTVFQGTANAPANVAGNASWVDYSGAFNYAGSSGTTNMGFEAIGGSTSGNFLDDIQIELAPFAEFSATSTSSPEAVGGNLPALRVNGTVLSTLTVTVNITGGTATLGTDYTTPGNATALSVTVPPGIYDGVSASSRFPVPITVVNDTLAEGNETIVFQVVPPPAVAPPFLLASSAVCGANPQASSTYTIIDDDAAVSLTKNVVSATLVPGFSALVDVVYSIEVANASGTLSASYSLVDTPGFDPDATVVTAAFTRNGGASTALPTVAPWTLQAQWRTLAAGATDNYLLNVRLNIARGGSVGNDACLSPSAAGNGLHNAVRAVVQGSGGNPDTSFDASACTATPTPVWVTLRKQLLGRIAPNDQAQVRFFSGGIQDSSATTTGSALPASASTGVRVIPDGNTVQFEEAIKTNGVGADRPLTGYVPSISCSNAGTPAPLLPSGTGVNLGDRQQWQEFTPPAGADIDCTITNAIQAADLRITKSNGVNGVVSGTATSYAIVVSNAGPSAAGGAVVRDPTPTGMTCSTTSCGSAAGGATCPAPAALTVAALQSAPGVAIPTLPAGGQLTITLGCQVN